LIFAEEDLSEIEEADNSSDEVKQARGDQMTAASEIGDIDDDGLKSGVCRSLIPDKNAGASCGLR
jgi:hypothetical protein